MENRLLSEPLLEFGSNRALHVQGVTYSYEQLDRISRIISAELTGSLVAVLGGRTFETYAGLVAVMRSGRTYVPLNSELPDEALCRQIALASPDVLLVDPSMAGRASRLLGAIARPLTVVCPTSVGHAFDQRHRCVTWTEGPAPPADETDVETDLALYQMFTSGTTGEPKRIAIPRNNVVAYLKEIQSAFDFRPDDRFSQFYKLSFDLSVHDLLVAWTSGGCVCVPSPAQLLDPVSFANKHDLSVWFSVPSLVRLAMITRKLSPGSLPNVRQALFCGEALTWEIARAFSKAAPRCTITNLYGPTETTIAITRHRLSAKSASPRQTSQTSVPIGKPFAEQEAVVVDAHLRPTPGGEIGELLLGGSQLAPGYLDDPEKTASKFLKLRFDGFNSERWYRTGDLARFDRGDLIFVGREDTQIKFRGHRIELGEIEAALADVANSPLAVVMPSSATENGSIDSLIALVGSPHEPVAAIRRGLRDRLPAYMLPAEIITIPKDGDWWNANGKLDRDRLFRWHESNVREIGDERAQD